MTTNSVSYGTLPTTVAWKDIFDAATVNDMQTLKRCVEEENFPLNQTNLDQQTVAHIAVKEKNLVMIKYLLRKEPGLLTMKDKWDQTVLTVAVDVGDLHIVRYLVDELKADFYHPNNQRFGNNGVHIAAEEGQLQVLKYFIVEKKADVNIRNFLQEPPVFLAAEKPYMRIIKYLVEKANADVKLLDSNDDNILYTSAKNGDLKVPKYLLDERKIDFDINWKDYFGRTIVYVASRFNQLPFIKYCVEEKGADIHIANNRGYTPLHEAAFIGNLDVVKYLLEKGADVHAKDKQNQTADQVTEHKKVIDFLHEVKEKRSRRSIISESKFIPFKPIFISYNEKMIAGTEDGGVAENKTVSKLQSFLMIANVVSRYLRVGGLWRPRERNEELLSPQQIIFSKIDPTAIQAVSEFDE